AGDFDFVELARRITSECRSLRHVVVAGEAPPGMVSLATCLSTESRVPASALGDVTIDSMDPAVLQLSGGTTGVPKLIPRLHNDYVYNSKTAATMVDVRPGDALLVVLPIAHNLPLACPGIQGFFLRGARAVLRDRKSTRLNSSHVAISYAVFCLKKKKKKKKQTKNTKMNCHQILINTY